jgi:tetratricopeptide (TPR) repeat protein
MSLRNHLLRLRQTLGRRWPGLVLALLAVVGAVVAAPHLRAWQHYRAGRAALERDHAEEALAELEACLRVWPGDGKARLLAARAARRAGRFDEAARHLGACEKSLGSSEEVLLEWSLQRAAAGDLAPVEPYLQSRLRPAFLPDGPLIHEAIAAGHLWMYRFLDAYPYLDRWLEQQPDKEGVKEWFARK